MLRRIPEGDKYDSRGLSGSETPGTATSWFDPVRVEWRRIGFSMTFSMGKVAYEERNLWDG
jgi:hypothetical protein